MNLYKDTLMDHFRSPKFKFEGNNHNKTKDGVNPSCGDTITLYVDMLENSIKNISFTGNGCAISMASADIMCEVITNIDNSLEGINMFLDYINGDDAIIFPPKLEVLKIFGELQQYPVRRNCAILPWKTLKSLLTEQS
ncbi:MAG: SUF system NifU family Fe-S cluster assembly protein [Spirochaetaceae bacterium 4572_7]|nr:MAG: SUF system NifU family Fe-S cluster assembly protein [Spirochaetaceae bacterium 4572_7]